MSRLPHLRDDDDNDTSLFDRLEEHVLLNCPNPERVGCPSSSTLEAFVRDPGSVSLEQLNELHIMQCAECTRELIGLRKAQEVTQRDSGNHTLPISAARSHYGRFAAAACLFILLGSVFLLMRPAIWKTSTNEQVVAMTVDLRVDGPSRGGADEDLPRPKIVLPRDRVQLHLLLPYFSRSGNYTVGLSTSHTGEAPRARGNGLAISSGPNTEVQVSLDLRRVTPGKYYLSTTLVGDGSPSIYEVSVN